MDAISQYKIISVLDAVAGTKVTQFLKIKLSFCSAKYYITK